MLSYNLNSIKRVNKCLALLHTLTRLTTNHYHTENASLGRCSAPWRSWAKMSSYAYVTRRLKTPCSSQLAKTSALSRQWIYIQTKLQHLQSISSLQRYLRWTRYNYLKTPTKSWTSLLPRQESKRGSYQRFPRLLSSSQGSFLTKFKLESSRIGKRISLIQQRKTNRKLVSQWQTHSLAWRKTLRPTWPTTAQPKVPLYLEELPCILTRSRKRPVSTKTLRLTAFKRLGLISSKLMTSACVWTRSNDEISRRKSFSKAITMPSQITQMTNTTQRNLSKTLQTHLKNLNCQLATRCQQASNQSNLRQRLQYKSQGNTIYSFRVLTGSPSESSRRWRNQTS